jgi:hypothetical protein
MRTKTLALSALLGMLGTAALVAQTNVYSLNAVGYVNVTFPAGTYTILTCPLICSPDNTLNSVLPDTNAQYKKALVYQYSGGAYTVTENGVGTGADPSGWGGGGADVTLNPGQAVFFYNPTAADMQATFVGQVPQGSLTNALIPGYNLVGSIVPTSGDLPTNSITQLTNYTKHDFVYTYDPVAGYSGQDSVVAPGNGSGYNNQWTGGDPVTTNVTQGFWYFNNSAATNNWVETFSVNP